MFVEIRPFLVLLSTLFVWIRASWFVETQKTRMCGKGVRISAQAQELKPILKITQSHHDRKKPQLVDKVHTVITYKIKNSKNKKQRNTSEN